MALFLLLGSCKKEAVIEECPQVTRAPQAFLDYWFFPEGSYWVYQRRGSVPAVVDTVRVRSTKVRLFKPGQATYGLPTCVELYETHLSHSNRTVFRGLSSLQNFVGTEHMYSYHNGSTWSVEQGYQAGNLYSLGLMLTYPLLPPGAPVSPDGPTLLDTLAVTVPAGHFPRSRHFVTSFRDSTAANFLRRFQLTPGVGYTRKVYTQLGTWELVAYKINR